MKKTADKKPFSAKKTIIVCAIAAVLAVALIIGNVFALKYENLLTVFFSGSDYTVTEYEKELCERLEGEGIVLLKNEDGALPLKEQEKKLALLGQNSVDFVYGGAGSGSVDASLAPDLKTALTDDGFTVNETLWKFYDSGAGKGYRKAYPDESGKGNFAVNEVPMSVFTDPVKASLDNDDVGVVVLGRSGGESSDLPMTTMPTGYKYLEPDKNELDTIKLACEKFAKVVLIVNSSNPMELGVLEDAAYANVKAALWVGAVGQEGMRAIGKTLAGTINPSGRLVDTYAYDSLSAPSAANMGDYSLVNSTVRNGNKYVVYQEGIYVGYRYYETRYEDHVLSRPQTGEFDYASEVQYPFGYGMSYSEFVWSDLSVKDAADGKSREFSVTVKNNGDLAGKEVVQIYMQSEYTDYDAANGIEKSAIELVGFAKTKSLAPDEEQTVTVVVDNESMKSYDAKGAGTYIVGAGDYYFAAGRNAHDALNNILAKKGYTPENTDNRMTAAGDADMAAVYNVATADTTTYATADTGAKIENRFTEADVSYYDEITYLTRSDWTGTMPASAYKNGSWTAPKALIEDLEFYRADEVVNDPAAKTPVMNSSATSHTVQSLAEVGYDDVRWSELVSQLSRSQVTRLVRMGGYSTIRIDKIGLPMTLDKDGPSGFSNTLVGGVSVMAWPAEVVMASTWNVELMEEIGKAIGTQSIDAGVAGWYAPGVNIHRSPYSGRNFEYFSEDGFLSGKIGAAEMRGVRERGVIAYMKHFALNDQERNRYGGAIFANEQTIRQISLKGFELTVREGGAIAAMASMNRIGARWAGAHKGLMTHVLRDEWGFEGVVITDQASVPSMFYQDMISGLWAGTDLWLNTDETYWKLDDWFDNPTVMSNVQKAAKNIVYAVTNSNAVKDYDGGGLRETNDGMPVWKILMIVLDVVVFAACAAAIAFALIMFIRGRKKISASK